MSDGGPVRRAATPWGALPLALLPLAGLLDGGAGPLRVVGSPRAELWGHLWVQGWHAAALPAWPGPGAGRLLPAQPWAAIDPLPTALAAGARRLGLLCGLEPGAAAALGHDLLVACALLLAFFGGAKLSARLGGHPAVGGLALAWAPALMGSAASGLSEDLGLGLLALALAALCAPLRPLRAGLLAGLLPSAGLLLAWSGGLLLLIRGLAGLRGPRGRRLLLGALLAAGLCLPAALPQLDRLAHQRSAAPAATGAPPTPAHEPLWRLNPVRRADLLSLVAPGPAPALGPDALLRAHPGYLGLSLLLLAAAAPRRLRWAWGPPLLLLTLAAAGPAPTLAGRPLGLPNPAAALIGALPLGGLVHHHARLLLPVAVGLAGLAGAGAARLCRGRPWVGLLLMGVVAVDLGLGSPLPLPLPTAAAPPLPISAALGGLPPGPLLVLPAAGPGVHAQRPLADQVVHGRALIIDPNQPGLPPGPWARAGRTLEAHLRGQGPAPTAWPAGVAVIIVLDGFVEQATAALGPPDRVAAGGAAWGCAGRGACPAPDLSQDRP